MYQRCSRVAHLECPDISAHGVPLLVKFRKTLGKLQVHVKETGKLGTFWMYLQFPQSFPGFYRKWYTMGGNVRTFQMCHSGTSPVHRSSSFWVLLARNTVITLLRTPQVHFKWATREHQGYFLWENSRCSHGVPNQDILVTWPGKLWMYQQFSFNEPLTLGTKPSFPVQYTVNTLQGNGQWTYHIPTQYTASTFRIFPAGFPAISLVQEMISTFRVFPVMWLWCPN